MDARFDLVVIGGGITGRSVAFELGRRRLGRIARVDDPARPGASSPVAAGFLPVASMRSARGTLFELGRASLSAFPEFLARIADAGGASVPFG